MAGEQNQVVRPWQRYIILPTMKKFRIVRLALFFVISCALAGDVDETDPKFLELAKKLALHADTRSPEFLGSYFDVDAFVRRVMPGKSENAQVQSFLTEVRKRMKSFGPAFLKDMDGDVPIRLVGVRKQNGGVHAIISAHQGIGLAYFGFVLQKNAEGSATVVDLYDVSGGQNSSDEMRAIMLGSFSEHPETADSIFGAGSGDLAMHLPKLPLINRALDAGNSLKALKLIDSMPAKMQAWRSVRTAKIVAASTSDEALMLRTIEKFEADYPGDPSLAVLTFGRLFKQKKYADALEAIRRIEAIVGNDTYLDLVRSRVRQLMGDLKEARRLCLAGMQAFPNVLDVHYQWCTILAEQKDFAGLVGAFTAMKKLPRGIELAESLLTMDEFAAFVKSLEYQAWIKK